MKIYYITLEKHGVWLRIFEKRNRVGDRFVNGEATFSIFNRPIKDELKIASNKIDTEVLKILTPIIKMVNAVKGE